MELYILQVIIMLQQIGTTWNKITYITGSTDKKVEATNVPDVWIILHTCKKKSTRCFVTILSTFSIIGLFNKNILHTDILARTQTQANHQKHKMEKFYYIINMSFIIKQKAFSLYKKQQQFSLSYYH